MRKKCKIVNVTNIVFDTNPDDYMSLRVVGQRALLKILKFKRLEKWWPDTYANDTHVKMVCNCR